MSKLLTQANTETFTFDGRYALGLSAKQLADEATAAIDKLVKVYGFRTNYAVRGLAWAIKSELNSMVRTADNAVTASMGVAITSKDSARIEKMTDKVEAVADWAEQLFDQYQSHADIISTLGDYAFELHPFQRAIEAGYEVNNDLDADEHDILTFDDEDDEAAQWLAEMELVREMAQDELRTRKSNVTQAMDAERKVVYEDISKAEWIEDRLERTPDEWIDAAQYGAWGAIRAEVTKFKQSGIYGLCVEYMGDFKDKPLSTVAKLTRKSIDLEVRAKSLAERIEYIASRMNFLDNDAASLAIAASSNSKTQDELAELEQEAAELQEVREAVDSVLEAVNPYLDLVQLDTPVDKYTAFVGFDPIELIVNKLRQVQKDSGITVMPSELRQQALKLLGNPVIDTFDVEQWNKERQRNEKVTLWSLKYTHGERVQLVKYAEEIRKLSVVKYRMDELARRSNKLNSIVEKSKMRNKKPLALSELEAITNKFSF